MRTYFFQKNDKVHYLLVVVAMLVMGCSNDKSTVEQQPKKMDVANVKIVPAQRWHTYTTRLESPEEVTLMPRVSGVVERVEFKEGQRVKQGDVLFKIDDRAFVAALENIKAQIKSAEAALAQAKSERARAVQLSTQNAISEEQVQARTSALQQRQAQLNALRAQLKSAKLNLAFTSVKSPINGVISTANITKGNIVQAQKSVLTTIVSEAKLYAYLDIDERTWNNDFSHISDNNESMVLLERLGKTAEPQVGFIDFIDNKINRATGTLRVRAVFTDRDKNLKVGAFARLNVAASEVTEQAIIPERAIGTDLENNYVLVVNDNNVTEYRQVILGEKYGRFRAVTSGLSGDDIIAINGPGNASVNTQIFPNTVTYNTEKVSLLLSDFASPLLAKQ